MTKPTHTNRTERWREIWALLDARTSAGVAAKMAHEEAGKARVALQEAQEAWDKATILHDNAKQKANNWEITAAALDEKLFNAVQTEEP